jgi:hypothetical protein
MSVGWVLWWETDTDWPGGKPSDPDLHQWTMHVLSLMFEIGYSPNIHKSSESTSCCSQ